MNALYKLRKKKFYPYIYHRKKFLLFSLLFIFTFKTHAQVTTLTFINGSGELGYGSGWEFGYQISGLEFQRDWWPGFEYTFLQGMHFDDGDFTGNILNFYYTIPLGRTEGGWVEKKRVGNISYGFWGPDTRNSIRPFFRISNSSSLESFYNLGVSFNWTSDDGANGFHFAAVDGDLGLGMLHPLDEYYKNKNYFFVFFRYKIGFFRILW